MKFIKQGDKNQTVKKWQYFLIGQGYFKEVASGIFNDATHLATIAFQKKHKLKPDGLVGNITMGVAMQLGFGLLQDTRPEQLSDNFPAKPSFKPLITNAQRQALFGTLKYRSEPKKDNKEHIVITNNWEKENIVKISVPQLIAIKGTDTVYFHKKATKQLQNLFLAWEKQDLLKYIITWNGSYMPRFVRGSKTVLSNHAFGTAFDINVDYNKLGHVPALVGQKGSVRLLVETAHKHGFYWGGHFTRRDGMHFEIAVLK